MRLRWWFMPAVTAAGILLAGCGDDGDHEGSAAPAPPETTIAGSDGPSTTSEESTSSSTLDSVSMADVELEDAVYAYTEAFLGGDAEGSRALLSSRCQADTSANQWEQIVAEAHDLYGDATITDYTATVDGQLATTTYELTDPVLNQTEERWVLEDGGWRNDDC